MEETQEPPVVKTDTLTAWQCTTHAPILKSAGTDREWMDQADQRFPYRCLPLVIANSLGWDILNPLTFTAIWNGGKNPSDVSLSWPLGKACAIPQAHFGSGVLTFTLGHLFQTPTGMNLYVTGPPNEPKDGIQPLIGIVETDWCPATFTMNWIFTRPNHPVTFQSGEVYCRIFPIPRRITEDLTPEIRMIQENPDLAKQHEDWRNNRDQFNQGLKIPGSEYTKRKWQKEYFQGGGVEIWPKFDDHQTKLHQSEFTDHRPPEYNNTDLTPEPGLRPVTVTVAGKQQTIFLKSNSPHEKATCPYLFHGGKSS